MKKSRFMSLIAFIIGLPVMTFAAPSTEVPDRRDHGHCGVRHRACRYLRLLSPGQFQFQVLATSDPTAAFPTDVEEMMDILPFTKVNMEVGLDFMGALNFPLMGNTSLALIEDAFFRANRRWPLAFSTLARKPMLPIRISVT